ncbi:MAG: DUF3866 family protein [Acidimicrobiales bacterium]|nr:DUF3866 family protein [Acidimicrobiales bacterium]
MPSFRLATVAEDLGGRPGYAKVRLADGSRAYALTQLTGPVSVGDEVVVNTTAVELRLGSGGWHIVHANLSRPEWVESGPGHLMKLRYTSLQVDTGAVDEAEGASCPPELDGTPVVVAGVHSQLAPIVAAIGAHRPGTRVAYVMTDGAALPLAMSDLVAGLVERGLVHATVTAGHAFGGDLEALNVPSALAAARHHLDAEAIVVAMGPGIAGTGTDLGFTGLEAAPALDAAAWLGGRPIACLRMSDADPRPRHQGISHHSRTVLEATRSSVDVAVLAAYDLHDRPGGDRHRWLAIDPGDPVALLAEAGVRVTTMGRPPQDDRWFFASAAAAGVLAVHHLAGTVPSALPGGD